MECMGVPFVNFEIANAALLLSESSSKTPAAAEAAGSSGFQCSSSENKYIGS